MYFTIEQARLSSLGRKIAAFIFPAKQPKTVETTGNYIKKFLSY